MTRWRKTLPSGWIGGAVDRGLGVVERLEHARSRRRSRRTRATRGVGVVGGDGGDRFARVADDVGGEHRLVAVLEAVAVAPGTSSAVSTACDAGDRERGRRCRSSGCGPTGAASAASGPTTCPRPRGRRRTRTRPGPWGPRRAGSRCSPMPAAVRAGRRVVVADVMTSSPPALGGACCTASRTACEDPAVAGAAAEVARRSPRGLRARRARASRSSRSCTAMTRPGRAEAALHGAGLDERLLHVGERARRRRWPSTVVTSASSSVAASTRHAHTSAPSTSTEHEPHSPCSQPSFAPGSPSRSRST